MLAGVRAVLASGWAGLDLAELPAECAALHEYAAARIHVCKEQVPHEWLLPRCACAVFHGGAGTTAAAMRSGVPAVVTPVLFQGDQYFWGLRLEQLGVGAMLRKPLGQVTARMLSAEIQRCTQSVQMKEAAKALGDKLRAEEDGSVAGARVLTQLASASVSPKAVIGA